jgi:GT2 family glycosyltransferase
MGRPETASGTIQSIIDQIYLPEDIEVILVGVKANEVASNFNKNFIVDVVLEKNLNPAQTRMAGVDVAEGDWLLFVDDDIELDCFFLKKLVKILKSEPNLGAVGARLPGKDNNYFSRVTDLANFWSQQSLQAGSRNWLYGGAVAVASEIYHKIDGFDPKLSIGEEVDLTQRIRNLGFRVLYEPELIGYHNHRHTSFRKAISYFRHNGELAKYLFKVHPSLGVFSLKSIFYNTFQNLRGTIRLNKADYPKFLYYLPGTFLMYLIFNISLEYHRHKYMVDYIMLNNEEYSNLVPQKHSEKYLLKAIQNYNQSKKIRGLFYYFLAFIRGLQG